MKNFLYSQFVAVSKFEIILHLIIPMYFIIPILKKSICNGEFKIVGFSIAAIILTLVIAILRIKFAIVNKKKTNQAKEDPDQSENTFL